MITARNRFLFQRAFALVAVSLGALSLVATACGGGDDVSGTPEASATALARPGLPGIRVTPSPVAQPTPFPVYAPFSPSGDSLDPVLSRGRGSAVYVPNSAVTADGDDLPSLHAGPLEVTPLTGALSLTGHPITGLRDPLQDLEVTLAKLLADARAADEIPLADKAAAQDALDILLGDTQGQVYDGFPLLNFRRDSLTPDQIPGEFKMKRLVDTGETFVSQVDGLRHRTWEVTVNMLWYGQNFDADTFLLRVPFDAHQYDEFRINWRVYSLIQEDLATTMVLNDAWGRIFHGFDSTFEAIPGGHLAELTVEYPSLQHFRGIYTWGWGAHPPRVQFLQPVFESDADGTLNWIGRSFAERTADDLTLEAIGDAAPEKKAYIVATSALNGATGAEIEAMLIRPDASPSGTFREWLRLAGDLRQLPPEAWDVLAHEDGLTLGEFGDYDIVLAYANNEIYGATPYAQPDAAGKGGVIRDWTQGDVIRVKVINLDGTTHYYRNVDFGGAIQEGVAAVFPNGGFSFEKMNPKPTYGVPKAAEMQWRTGWGYMPMLGVIQQHGVFTEESDIAGLTEFRDQFGFTHEGYIFANASERFRFDPPRAARRGDGLDEGVQLYDSHGTGLLIGVDTEGFGVAQMPVTPITTHPDDQKYPVLDFPDFLENPGTGGDIIPPIAGWAPFLTLNPETGTLYDPDGIPWVDQTYFHGRPVPANGSIVASVEAPRSSGQLFYQFDPLFHDNMIFSYHPRSDAVR